MLYIRMYTIIPLAIIMTMHTSIKGLLTHTHTHTSIFACISICLFYYFPSFVYMYAYCNMPLRYHAAAIFVSLHHEVAASLKWSDTSDMCVCTHIATCLRYHSTIICSHLSDTKISAVWYIRSISVACYNMHTYIRKRENNKILSYARTCVYWYEALK